MKKSALFAALILLGACAPGLQSTLPPSNTNLSAQNSQGDPALDEFDLAPPPQINQQAIVDREIIKTEGQTAIFRAVPFSRQAPQIINTNSLGVRGQFEYYDLKGQLRPGANATVSLYQGSSKVGQVLTGADGRWEIKAPATGDYTVRFHFENPRWKIDRYQWEGPQVQVTSQGTIDIGRFTLEKGTKNAEAGFIQEVYNRALNTFAKENMDLSWWSRQINTVWPGRGNYYSFYTVNLTGAEQWDVNGHEVGHAIFAQALNARSRGGQHKIDECYNSMLAFSEGFASFFSGAIHLERNDPDAHFDKYLVPRRAPIRIENTPKDVCPGSENEWQVSSVLWDVYDTHVDGVDNMNLSLKEIFEAFGQRNKPAITSVLQAYDLLRERMPQAQQAQLREIFKQNTMEVQ